MTKKLILLPFLTLLLATNFAYAKPHAKPEPVPAVEKAEEKPAEKADTITVEVPPETAVDQENLKQLVETLESDTARAEFLTNLKTLMDQQKEQAKEAAPEPLTEQIGVRSFISDSVSGYEQFLSRHNLSGSLVNQALGSIIVLMIALVLVVCEKKMIKRLMRLTDKISLRFSMGVKHLRIYVRILNTLGQIVIAAVTVYTLANIWGVSSIDRFFESPSVRSVLSNGVTVLIVLFLAAMVWEAINMYLAYVLQKANSNNQTRAKTLLPIIRNIVVAVFAGLFGLVLLSELGINVTPLLAGAGVIGVAVGFGAQSMVKDFLTGFTIILEDIVRVGDVVNLAGASGSIEKITLRKIQLRDFAGTVYTIPYSEIKTIQNLTKDFSYYVMDIGVSYSQSTDKVIEVLRKVDEDLRKDDSFSFMILEPLEIAGLDKFGESSVFLKARIKTAAMRQWAVGREFNRRMKIAFDAAGIEMPFPQRTVNVRTVTGGQNPLSPEVVSAVAE